MSVRLVLADDHPLMLDGLEALFRSAGDFEVVARCRDGAEALHALRGRTPVVILTATANDEEVVEALRLGVRGVTPRTLGMSECEHFDLRGASSSRRSPATWGSRRRRSVSCR